MKYKFMKKLKIKKIRDPTLKDSFFLKRINIFLEKFMNSNFK